MLKITNVIFNFDNTLREPVWMFGVHTQNGSSQYKRVPLLLLANIKKFEVVSHFSCPYVPGEESQFLPVKMVIQCSEIVFHSRTQ